MPGTRAVLAFLASVGFHALLLADALAWRTSSKVRPVDPSRRPEPAAVWQGETFEVEPLLPLPPAPAAAPAVASSPEASSPEVSSPEVSLPESSRPTSIPPRRVPAERAPPRSTASHSAAPAAGSHGQTGVTAVSAPLGKGLLRALPRVAFVEPTFHELPFGTTGSVQFSVQLDADGRPALPLGFEEGQPRLPWLEAVLARALLLMRGGTFSLPQGSKDAGSASFELEFQVLQGEPASGDWLEPHDLAEMGRLIEPTELEPGRAHFRYNSGREVRLVLSLVRR